MSEHIHTVEFSEETPELTERLNRHVEGVIGDTYPVEDVPDDIAAFDAVLAEKRRVFMERHGQYGSHAENHARFPHEHRSGLYMKAARLIRDIENETVKRDTLLDLSNYCDIELANMEIE